MAGRPLLRLSLLALLAACPVLLVTTAASRLGSPGGGGATQRGGTDPRGEEGAAYLPHALAQVVGSRRYSAAAAERSLLQAAITDGASTGRYNSPLNSSLSHGCASVLEAALFRGSYLRGEGPEGFEAFLAALCRIPAAATSNTLAGLVDLDLSAAADQDRFVQAAALLVPGFSAASRPASWGADFAATATYKVRGAG